MRTALAALCFAIAACASSGAVAPPSPSAPLPAAGGLMVRLERGPCFGSCPAYTVIISPDGLVRYQGRGFVCEPGPVSDRLSAQQLADLRAAIARSPFLNTPEHCCDCPVTDSPTITLTVADPRRQKTIVDTYGCNQETNPVRALATEVDRVLQTERWIGTEEQRKNCRW